MMHSQNEFIKNVRESQEALRRFLMALCCGDSFLADDIAQEAYMRGWMAFDKFRGDASFSTWIRKIAYNIFINSQRTVAPFQPFDGKEQLSASPEQSDDAFRFQNLYQALDRLSARERAAVVLFYMEGYSVREIAGIQSATEDSIKKQLSRARTHLREIITKEKTR